MIPVHRNKIQANGQNPASFFDDRAFLPREIFEGLSSPDPKGVESKYSINSTRGALT